MLTIIESICVLRTHMKTIATFQKLDFKRNDLVCFYFLFQFLLILVCITNLVHTIFKWHIIIKQNFSNNDSRVTYKHN